MVDEFPFPEPDERASSMPDNMLPAGTNEVLRAKTNEGGYKLTTHCHKLLTIDITITIGILIDLSKFCVRLSSVSCMCASLLPDVDILTL